MAMRDVNRALAAEVAQLTGANSEPVKAAASVLRREIRRTLSTPGANRYTSLKTRRVRGQASEPGAPPAMQSGRLRRAAKSAVVDGVRRVGFNDFRARLLEFGGAQSAESPRQSKRKGAKPGTMTKGRRAIVIPPRPFMERSLAAAAPQMTDVMVGEMQKRTAKGAKA